jgi:hypothetical protein
VSGVESKPDRDERAFELDDGLEHEMCCMGDDLSLCGERFDDDDSAAYDSDGDPECRVCSDLLSVGFCPRFGRCWNPS